MLIYAKSECKLIKEHVGNDLFTCSSAVLDEGLWCSGSEPGVKGHTPKAGAQTEA